MLIMSSFLSLVSSHALGVIIIVTGSPLVVIMVFMASAALQGASHSTVSVALQPRHCETIVLSASFLALSVSSRGRLDCVSPFEPHFLLIIINVPLLLLILIRVHFFS